jgi:SNF2 family DNA or RNA helicase
MRGQIRREILSGKLDILLGTYTIFERESGKDDRKFLYSISFDYVVLDEGHCIKNANSSRYTNLCYLKAKRRLLLSGTPVQNDVSELLALLSYLMPKTFSKQDCEILVEAFNFTQGVSITQLRGILAPFVLRRLKRDVLDQLVEKVTSVERVQMLLSQKKIYDDIILSYAKRKERIKEKYKVEVQQDALLEIGSMPRKKKKVDYKENSDVINLSSPKCGTDIVDVDLASPFDFKDYTNSKVASPEKHVSESKEPSSSSDDDVIEVTSSEGASGEVTLDEDVSLMDTGNVNILRDISSSEAKHLFTALRKAANHPLLLRVRFNSEKDLDLIAQVALANGYFGNQCDLMRVREEMDSYSDFDIHQICLNYPTYLSHLELPAEALFDSPKMCRLREMLPSLIVSIIDNFT